MRRYWDGDGVWLAVDSQGHLAIFTTAGVAPIPSIVLDSYEYSLEDSVNKMPLLGGHDRLPYPGDLSSHTGFAGRGFFAFDWHDVHRTSGFAKVYELMARPASPIVASRLDAELSRLARLVTLETVIFDQTFSLRIERLLPVKRR